MWETNLMIIPKNVEMIGMLNYYPVQDFARLMIRWFPDKSVLIILKSFSILFIRLKDFIL